MSYIRRELLGSGRQGRVYRGVAVRDARAVAIKVGASEREFAMLVRLATMGAPCCVRAISFDGAELVMELVAGTPLDAYAGDLAPVLAQLRACVAWLHAHGIVHGDLKPAHVIVGEDGRLTLVDFGHARESHAVAVDLARLDPLM